VNDLRGLMMTDVLGLGKVTREVFNRSVLPYIPVEKEIELDGATTNLTGETVIAHSPSIGVPLEALGFFAFHYSASNVASKFGKPSHLISGIYLPLRSTEEELRIIAKSLGDEAKKYDVTITAGQTATYYGVEIPLLTSTCMGRRIKAPAEVKSGDKVLVAGAVGGEAVWLSKISRGEKSDIWKRFTPLPTILALQSANGIKLMHDVSEGGVKGSLLEIAVNNHYGLHVSSEGVALYKGAVELEGDIMRAPTYGALIIIAESDAVADVQGRCGQLGLPCSIIGTVVSERGLVFNGESIIEQERVNLDEIYGSFAQKDSLLDELNDAIKQIQAIRNLVGLIPEVGMNIVYAKKDASSANDIAGLSGRIIKAMGEPMSCGEVTYGASKYLASVVLEAMKHEASRRAAVNIRGGDDIKPKLESLGLKVMVLPSKIEGEGCPVAIHLHQAESMVDAYLHPGDYGVEATTTILGSSPGALVDLLEKLTSLE